MNDSTDLAMTMRDRAGWTGTDPGVSVLLINGAKALEEAEREVADERAIVNRVWKALAIATYEEAGGKAIDEHVAGLRREVAELREQLRLANIDATNEAAENAELREALHTLHNHATSFRAYCRGESPSLFTDEDHNVIDFDDAMARADAALKPHAQGTSEPKA